MAPKVDHRKSSKPLASNVSGRLASNQTGYPTNQGEPGEEDLGGGDDYDMPVIIKVKPNDQLDLTPEELEKEVPPRVLYPMNPRAAQNVTLYSLKEKAFKRDDQIDQCVFHFSMDGQILAKDSIDAQEQFEIQEKKEEEQLIRSKDEKIEEDFEVQEEEGGDPPSKNPLRNQFNFSERAAQSKPRASR